MTREADGPVGTGGCRSLMDEAREWLMDVEVRVGYGPHQVRRAKRIIEELLAWAKIETVEEFRPSVVVRWLRLRSEKVSRKTVLNDMGPLRAFGDWLVMTERVSTNPLRSVSLPRVRRGRVIPPFSVEEMRRIIVFVRRCEALKDGCGRRSTRSWLRRGCGIQRLDTRSGGTSICRFGRCGSHGRRGAART